MTTFERRHLQEQDSTPTRDELMDALRAVLEAIDIPHAATVGEQEIRDRILVERVGHVGVMLRGLLADDSWQDWSWSTAYLHERLAEHPYEGQYKTWEARATELEAISKASILAGGKWPRCRRVTQDRAEATCAAKTGVALN